MRTAELQHRQRTLPIVQRRIDRFLAAFEEELRDLDSELTQRLRESPVWREREELLRSVPGIGPVTIFSLLADLPCGSLDRREAAAIVGVAPYNRDSGKFRRLALRCWGGRAHVRAALYMEFVGVRFNPAEGVLRAACPGWQSQEGGAHCVHAEAAHDSQRHAQASHHMEPPDC